MTKTTILAAAFVFLSGCATTLPPCAEGQANSQCDASCRVIGDIDNFTVLDTLNIYVDGSATDQNYLVSFKSSCHGLINDVQLEIRGADKAICPARQSRITLRRATPIGTCAVEALRPVDDLAAAKALHRASQ